MKRMFLVIGGMIMAAVVSAGAMAAERWMAIPHPPAMPKAAESGMADVNGIKMYYAVYGKGSPVLMIHGGLAHGDIWAWQVKELMKTHKVIVADSRGHGRSTRDRQAYSYALMASDYLALLDKLGIKKTALVGWSDGGIIGLDIAIHHPERLTRLFAQAANATTDGVDPAVEKNATFGLYVERMAADYAKMSATPKQFNGFVEQISHMWATQPAYTKAQLAAIKVPTAIVLGDHDEAITRKHTDYLAAVIPGAKLIILKGVSHFAMLQDPEGYSRAVLAFIGGK